MSTGLPPGVVPASSYFFETAEAQEAADLVSIEGDLRQVEAVATELLARPEKKQWDAMRMALIDSIVIRYLRCFTSGLRTKLEPDLITKVAPQYRDIHSFFRDLGDKHIAHSVSSLEHAYAAVMVDERDPLFPKVVGQGVFNTVGDVSNENIRHLRALCQILREQYVAPRKQGLLAAFDQQVAKLTTKGIRKLKPAVIPVNLDHETIGKKRWRARRT